MVVLLTQPSGQRDGPDRGQQPFEGALLACGYQLQSRGYSGQPELISSWKILPLREAKTCCCGEIICLCETTTPPDSGSEAKAAVGSP